MRPVAIALVALIWMAALPSGVATTSHDECANAPAGSCVAVSVPRQAPPPANSEVPPPAGGLTYYLWAAGARCAPTFGDACSGRPAAGSPVIGLVGILYEETNSVSGLQRKGGTLSGQTFTADAMILA